MTLRRVTSRRRKVTSHRQRVTSHRRKTLFPKSVIAFFPALIAIGGAMLVSSLAMLILSENPGRGILYLIAGPAMNPLALGDTLAQASRLIIAGTAAALAFRSGVFNLGGEGQALAGGLAGAGIALLLPDIPGFAAPLAAVIAGVSVGALLGIIPGILKAGLNVDELISSFLISSAVAPLGHYLLSGPMKDKGSYLIAAAPLPENWLLVSWISPSRFGPVALWALFVVLAVFIFLEYTRKGYEWKLRGANETFARYGGIRTGWIAVGSMAASGGLFGLAGTAALLDGGQAVQGFTGGLGWDGLAVALIAASRPRWIPVAALAYAWITMGTQAAMIHTNFPYALSGLVQATVFLLITAEGLIRQNKRGLIL